MTPKITVHGPPEEIIDGQKLADDMKGHRELAEKYQTEARHQLLGLLVDDRPVYFFRRYISRRKQTAIVEFFVIFSGEPLYISARIGTLLGRYSIPKSEHSGLVLKDHETPANIAVLLELKINKHVNLKEL